jgi:hypothetical protein
VRRLLKESGGKVKRGIFGLAALLALALLATGCGSGGGTSTAAATPSKAQYIKQGDAICRNVPVRYREALARLPKDQQKESITTLAVPVLRRATDEFEKLGAPVGDEQKAEAMVAALKAAADGLEEAPDGALNGPKSPFGEFNKLTKAYGFQVCSAL